MTAAESLFSGVGTMRVLCRRFDWDSTPLGLVEQWPQALRAMTTVALGSPVAMVLLWGPQLVQIYNDRFSELMGNKCPGGLGQPVRDCWPEAWNFGAPLYEGVMQDGESFTFEDQPLVLQRQRSPERVFLSLTFSPIPLHANSVGPAGGGTHTNNATTACFTLP
jgi:hypothetical protein